MEALEQVFDKYRVDRKWMEWGNRSWGNWGNKGIGMDYGGMMWC